MLCILTDVLDCNLSPQGDGNIMGINMVMAVPHCNLSPQGDGNPIGRKGKYEQWHCNLSPQGDGNLACFAAVASVCNCNLSPQGDGNGLISRHGYFHRDCNLSPQGDGNTPNMLRARFFIRLQFIPARGRKPFVVSPVVHLALLQFIPARGQKSTSATGVCQQRRCFAFSYILFYRLGAAPDGIVFVTGSALTPCGTFRFKGRISCR